MYTTLLMFKEMIRTVIHKLKKKTTVNMATIKTTNKVVTFFTHDQSVVFQECVELKW